MAPAHTGIVSHSVGRLKQPALFGFLLAALITLPLAGSVFQVPIQVSDSLEAIVIAAKYSSASQLLSDSLRFSTTTLRPMRYLQARWLLDAARRTNVTYNAVFRAAHVALLGLLVALFVLVVPVKNWTDLAAFSVALLVLLGIHTFVAMLQEAFPVNHYAEVGVCALGVFVIARQPPRWFFPVLVCLLLAFALSVIESGAMVWVVAVCCAAAGMRGMTRSSVIAATLVLGAYLLARYALEISSPGIGGHGSGFGATFYSPDELKQRFAAHPLPFYAYNIGGALLSILFSEPRNGVYSLAIARHAGGAHPVLIINVLSSSIITAVIVWYAATRIGRSRAVWSDSERAFLVSCMVIIANAALNAAYMKDEIISVGGLFYAVAAFIAVRALLDTTPRRTLASGALIAVLLATSAGLWAFRAAGMHYVLRYDAFKTRNDWVEVLRPDKREDWPRDERELAITRAIRDEVIARRVASPSFMPRWADRYWVE
jgi:hypothetical protein